MLSTGMTSTSHSEELLSPPWGGDGEEGDWWGLQLLHRLRPLKSLIPFRDCRLNCIKRKNAVSKPNSSLLSLCPLVRLAGVSSQAGVLVSVDPVGRGGYWPDCSSPVFIQMGLSGTCHLIQTAVSFVCTGTVTSSPRPCRIPGQPPPPTLITTTKVKTSS